MVTGWLEIDTVLNPDCDQSTVNEDEGTDEDGNEEYHSVIDPNGFCVPLSLVMRAN